MSSDPAGLASCSCFWAWPSLIRRSPDQKSNVEPWALLLISPVGTLSSSIANRNPEYGSRSLCCATVLLVSAAKPSRFQNTCWLTLTGDESLTGVRPMAIFHLYGVTVWVMHAPGVPGNPFQPLSKTTKVIELDEWDAISMTRRPQPLSPPLNVDVPPFPLAEVSYRTPSISKPAPLIMPAYRPENLQWSAVSAQQHHWPWGGAQTYNSIQKWISLVLGV